LHRNVGDPATYANNIDPDSYLRFAAKIENYNYGWLGIKPMLAVHSTRELAANAASFDTTGTVALKHGDAPALYR